MLKRAIVSRLAAELSYPITSDPAVIQQMYDLYAVHVSEGLAIDGQQGSGDLTRSRDLHDVRN